MPFHHVTAGLLYKGNYLNRSLSAGSDSEQLANISVEELDGECCPRFPRLWGWGRLLCTFSGHSMRLPGGIPAGKAGGKWDGSADRGHRDGPWPKLCWELRSDLSLSFCPSTAF